MTVATYAEQPAGDFFDFKQDELDETTTSFVDLQIIGASPDDIAVVTFYYPATIVGAAEDELELVFYDAASASWTRVLSHPLPPDYDTVPVKNTLDNQDGTISGGTFTVVFGSNSTPQITELTGTIFAMALVQASIDSVQGPAAPVPAGTATDWTVEFYAMGLQARQRVTFFWGDAAGSSTSVTPATPGIVTATHTYAEPGVYTVKIRVVDGENQESATYYHRYAVVYDPEGGFVTGGGWITSWPGAFLANPELTGKAIFGFNSRYQRGASVPTGQTQFEFQTAGFTFKSTAYEWLVVSGARAQYKGVGKVNGAGDYGFLLTATDGQISGGGGTDKFRIKIWDRTTDLIVYDNVPGEEDDLDNANPQILGGGNIVIHNPPPGRK
jgi:hypothetical protein